MPITINRSEFFGETPGCCKLVGLCVVCNDRSCPVKRCFLRDKYSKRNTLENPFKEEKEVISVI